MSDLTPELILRAYAAGVFPMAESADSEEIFWLDPEQRAILPLQNFHLPHRLKRTLRAETFEVACDRAFPDVIQRCAEATTVRPSTWINPELQKIYSALHSRGYAHSVESWCQGQLMGGLYGVALGGAFFGESMFSRATDASKVALAHLVARLKLGGFTLLDIQFVTPHLKQFGATTISRAAYHGALAAALTRNGSWPKGPLQGLDAIVAAEGDLAAVRV
jgi:leucyl/phenylalanyl-tRNA---protein transferase